MTTTTTPRPHAIRCAHCKNSHATVAEVRRCATGGMWLTAAPLPPTTRHLLTPVVVVDPFDEPEPVPAPRPVGEVTEGMWISNYTAGTVYKVQRAVNGSGHLYGKVLDPESGKFGYLPGALRTIAESARPMTLDEAKEFGHLYGMCCVCGRTLTDEGSIEAGIGPICAKRF